MRLLSVQDALLFRFRLIIPAFFRNFAACRKLIFGPERSRGGPRREASAAETPAVSRRERFPESRPAAGLPAAVGGAPRTLF